MGRIFLKQLEGDKYSCKYCHAHLAFSHHILPKTFVSSYGKAFLFDQVVNIIVGKKEDRMMITGLHTVSDIFCVGCSSVLGWKYETAFNTSQKDIEGKFILERCKVLEPNGVGYVSPNHEPQVESESDVDEV